MQRGDADIAVHSMKDVPVEMPAGFTIAAMLDRANPADALVTRDGGDFTGLPHGAHIGSSSLRRQAQIKALRPDISVSPLRGNVNTRLQKLDRGDFDAIVLAAAGLERLGMFSRVCHEFTPTEMLPAASQGVIGIECRDDDAQLIESLKALDHGASRVTTLAERAVSTALQADCQSPVASYAVIDGSRIMIDALVAAADGSEIIRDTHAGNVNDAESLGAALARRLLDRGAGKYLS